MRRWYQTIPIDGVEQNFEDLKRKDSKFWNEGKWRTFIEPLLPKERQTFLEIGCNAGLMLKQATDAGFKRVIGVEANKQIVGQAQAFKESNGYEYKIIYEKVGRNFDIENLCLPDVVLFSNSHYYIKVNELSKLVDRLKYRALYCIVVSAKTRSMSGKTFSDLESVRGYFGDWEEVGLIENVSIEGDPTPRETMYGILFKSQMKPLGVHNYHGGWMDASQNEIHKSYGLSTALMAFLRLVLDGTPFEYEDTDLYKYWRKRKPNRTEYWTRKMMVYRHNLALDIQKNGIKEPIYLDKGYKLLDGLHRLCAARILGYKHIIARIF